jgi:hypothetical protein
VDGRKRVIVNQNNSSATAAADASAIVESPTPLAETRERVLKIEAIGDLWSRGIKPKIRLCGLWLERAGFKPGHKVRVISARRGELTLRCEEPPVSPNSDKYEIPQTPPQKEFGGVE